MATRKAAKKAAVKKSPKAAQNADPSKSCFTIMPFGGWFNDYYETIYRPAIESAGLVACRADDLFRPSTIVHDIWEYTQKASVILADLSGKNPNVFYELGLAHALAKPAILITESIDDVPFDLRALRVLEYDKNEPRWGENLQVRITNAINEVSAAPLQSVLPAFLSVSQTAKPKPISEGEKNILELRRDIDLLRNEVSHLRVSRRPIGPNQAKERISNYVSQGMPTEMIVRRVRDMGVPTAWILRQIDALSAPGDIAENGQGGDNQA
jgi:hypothetical protein